MNIVAIIQARMGSTRLPGKVLKEVMGKTLLAYHIERVKQSKLIHKIVIATTENKKDHAIVGFCESNDVHVYRGSENDVLARYYKTAIKFEADVIVRLTSDCPLIDPIIIDEVIGAYLNKEKEIDYASNTLVRSYPRGLDVEVFSFKALEAAYIKAKLESEREHVTPYIYHNDKKFNIVNVKLDKNLASHRWTVDTRDDFELVKRIIEATSPKTLKMGMNNIVDLLEKNPDWIKINAHIEQKKL